MNFDYTKKAKKIRRDILTSVYTAGSGHLGGSLSAVEIMLALYGEVMRCDPKNPKWDLRDRFVLSKGHAAPVLYATLADMGFFSQEHLQTLRKPGSILQGHPDMKKTPGVDFSSGSLGQGLSVGLGMALALRQKKIDSYVYVLLGDGELNEGQNWEAAMAAGKYRAARLIGIVDRNRVQLDGTSDEILPLEPLRDKWASFGWNVIEANGHSVENMTEALKEAQRSLLPCVIIAETVKGKGVSFMEGNFEWHGGIMSEEEYDLAMREVGSLD